MRCCNRTRRDEVNLIIAGESRRRVDVNTTAKHGMLICGYKKECGLWSDPFLSNTRKNSGDKGLIKEACTQHG
jgi:hypothetical protein